MKTRQKSKSNGAQKDRKHDKNSFSARQSASPYLTHNLSPCPLSPWDLRRRCANWPGQTELKTCPAASSLRPEGGVGRRAKHECSCRVESQPLCFGILGGQPLRHRCRCT